MKRTIITLACATLVVGFLFFAVRETRRNERALCSAEHATLCFMENIPAMPREEVNGMWLLKGKGTIPQCGLPDVVSKCWWNDPWGMPYRFEYSLSIVKEQDGNSTSGVVRVWSCGPNRRDDHASGDDIGGEASFKTNTIRYRMIPPGRLQGCYGGFNSQPL
jgi:hypothetical protein